LRLTLCLLRRFLRLLSFLRHTALLAMMRWRYRNSAVANRHALRSDYYSTTKKTANPLNEWWTTVERRDEGSSRCVALPRRCGARAMQSIAHLRSASSDARNVCGAATSAMRKATRRVGGWRADVT